MPKGREVRRHATMARASRSRSTTSTTGEHPPSTRSVHDLVSFRMFLLKNRVPGQRRIPSDAAIDSMFGTGEYHGHPSRYFAGGMPGMSTSLLLLPSHDIVVAVVVNSRSSDVVTHRGRNCRRAPAGRRGEARCPPESRGNGGTGGTGPRRACGGVHAPCPVGGGVDGDAADVERVAPPPSQRERDGSEVGDVQLVGKKRRASRSPRWARWARAIRAMAAVGLSERLRAGASRGPATRA